MLDIKSSPDPSEYWVHPDLTVSFTQAMEALNASTAEVLKAERDKQAAVTSGSSSEENG